MKIFEKIKIAASVITKWAPIATALGAGVAVAVGAVAAPAALATLGAVAVGSLAAGMLLRSLADKRSPLLTEIIVLGGMGWVGKIWGLTTLGKIVLVASAIHLGVTLISLAILLVAGFCLGMSREDLAVESLAEAEASL